MTHHQIRTRLFSVKARKRLGKFNQYGQQQYGFSNYGTEDVKIYWARDEDGNPIETEELPATVVNGVYKSEKIGGKRVTTRYDLYITRNPRTEAQQENRAKMTAAVEAWQALTDEQKEPYRTRASRRNFSGYNLFLREYMLTA